MKRYEICMDYTASVIYEIEAENEDLAEKEARRRARETVPYDDLSVTVGYVEEMDEEE